MLDTFLPIVKPEICGSLMHDFDFDKETLKKVLKEIAEENPVIALWIKKYSKKTRKPIDTAICGIVVYKMLASQAEANRMRIEFDEQSCKYDVV